MCRVCVGGECMCLYDFIYTHVLMELDVLITFDHTPAYVHLDLQVK